LVNKT